MKYLLFFVLFSLAPSSLLATIDTKHYCTAAEIELNDHAIYVRAGNDVFEIEALEVDQGGIYYKEKSLRCPECRRYRGINPKNTCENPHCPTAQ